MFTKVKDFFKKEKRTGAKLIYTSPVITFYASLSKNAATKIAGEFQ